MLNYSREKFTKSDLNTQYNSKRKPPWLKISLATNNNMRELKKSLLSRQLHTVCEAARCPNKAECWGKYRTASFMILGDICTRRCRFCAVSSGKPGRVDLSEPLKVAAAVREMGLEHVVITMVTRDDLADGGAAVLAATVTAIHRQNPACTVEVLSSDLQGRAGSIEILTRSRPEIVGHNLETVSRLSKTIRFRSTYRRSLDFLRAVKSLDPTALTKSSLMLGLGESSTEIAQAMDDLLSVGVSILNLGQYLQPTKHQVPVVKYWSPQEFLELEKLALLRGFTHCESGPLVRSSYHAGEQYKIFRRGH